MLASLFLVVLSVTASVAAEVAKSSRLTVKFNKETQKHEVSTSSGDCGGDACGHFYANYQGSGWNYLDMEMTRYIATPSDYMDKSFSLGFLEGFSTCEQIHTFYPNFYSAVFGTDLPGNGTIQFLQDNYDWLNAQAEANWLTDSYWFNVKSILQQLRGLYTGYQGGCPQYFNPTPDANPWDGLENPQLMHFLLINAWGDLYQITMKYREVGNPVRLALARLNKKKFEDQMKSFERCSAIIKLLPDKSDVVFGHATWDTYESLGPRILKKISKPVYSSPSSPMAPQNAEIYYSSSPAILSSVDDFFVIPKGLSPKGIAVIETTNSLYNLRLLDQVTPQSVLSWTRAVASNQMAVTGTQWGQLFSKYQSGTYTNQWMAIDFNQFTPGQGPSAGFLTVFEEVPGLVHVEDQTAALLRDSYWGSYNVPFYADIQDASGYAKLCKAGNDDSCHDKAPRALIFKEYQDQITNVDGGKWMLGYNSYQNDTASAGDPCNAIACRGDLYEKGSGGAFGALDVKVSSVMSMTNGNPQIHARLGPTTDQQAPFCWSQISDHGYVHQGQPDCYDFEYAVIPPQ